MTLSQQSPIGQPDAAACGDGGGGSSIPDQRIAPRFTLLFRSAKLIAEEDEFLVVLRDVSHRGIRIKTFHPLPVDVSFAIELASGDRHEVERIWQDGEFSGFRFQDPVALEKLLAEGPAGKRRRPIRLRLRVPVKFHAGGRCDDALILDISQSGACIACDGHLAIGERIRIECPGLPELTAGVRWRRRPLYGLNLEQTFQFDDLARLTARFATGAEVTER